MKKLICMILAAALMTGLLTGCGAQKKEKEVDLTGVYTKMQETLPEMMTLDAENMLNLLGINVASALGIDVTGVVAVASVLTLAVSLAMQNLLTNLVGGFTILTTHPFHSGDFVDIGDESGTVDEISMTYTRLITPDNKVVFVPNSTVAASQITNYTVGGTRRAEIKVTASYDMEAQDVIDALLQAAQVEKVLQDPAPFAALASYDDSAIGYVLRFWAKTEDYWDVYFQVNQRIQAVFAENKIEMCYPHLNVHLDKQQ